MIGSAALHQRVVRATFDDVTVFQHHEPVGADDTRKTMGKDQRGPSQHQTIQRLLNDGLVLSIDRRQRLIKYEYRCVAQHRPGNCNALALATRQANAALANHGFIALWQQGDKFVGVSDSRGIFQLLQRSLRLAHKEIVPNGTVKQVGVLVNNREAAVYLVEA